MKKRLIIIILALVLLGGAGTGVWFISDSFYRQTRKRLEIPFKELNLTVCVGEGNDQLKSTYNVVTVGTETKITRQLSSSFRALSASTSFSATRLMPLSLREMRLIDFTVQIF